MHRLSILVGVICADFVVITAFSLGFYSVHAILTAGGLSLAFSWPFTEVISRRIKRSDPNPHHAPAPIALPDPSAPEV